MSHWSNRRSGKYRSNNPGQSSDSSKFIEFDAKTTETRPRAAEKNWSLSVIFAFPASIAKKKILFDLKAIAFATKQKSWFRRKGNFADVARARGLVYARACAAIYAIIYRHRKRVITFHCFAMPSDLIVIIVVIAADAPMWGARYVDARLRSISYLADWKYSSNNIIF